MSEERLSDYYLERYALGELPADMMDKIRRRLASDPALRAALDEIEASNRDVLERYPVSMIKERLDARAAAGRVLERPAGFLPWKRLLTLSSVCAAAALVLVLVFPLIKKEFGGRGGTVLAPIDETRIKGNGTGSQAVDLSTTQLLVHRKTGESVELLKNGDLARPGDLLQLAYVSAGEMYGIILSIDGKGVVTMHFPVDGAGAAALETHQKVLLPDAIELDDAPVFERFFFVSSESPLDPAAILNEARDLAARPDRGLSGSLILPDGVRQYSILILKGERS